MSEFQDIFSETSTFSDIKCHALRGDDSEVCAPQKSLRESHFSSFSYRTEREIPKSLAAAILFPEVALRASWIISFP